MFVIMKSMQCLIGSQWSCWRRVRGLQDCYFCYFIFCRHTFNVCFTVCVYIVLIELKKDGFGTLSYYGCIVAEQLTDGRPSKQEMCAFRTAEKAFSVYWNACTEKCQLQVTNLIYRVNDRALKLDIKLTADSRLPTNLDDQNE